MKQSMLMDVLNQELCLFTELSSLCFDDKKPNAPQACREGYPIK